MSNISESCRQYDVAVRRSIERECYKQLQRQVLRDHRNVEAKELLAKHRETRLLLESRAGMFTSRSTSALQYRPYLDLMHKTYPQQLSYHCEVEPRLPSQNVRMALPDTSADIFNTTFTGSEHMIASACLEFINSIDSGLQKEFGCDISEACCAGASIFTVPGSSAGCLHSSRQRKRMRSRQGESIARPSSGLAFLHPAMNQPSTFGKHAISSARSDATDELQTMTTARNRLDVSDALTVSQLAGRKAIQGCASFFGRKPLRSSLNASQRGALAKRNETICEVLEHSAAKCLEPTPLQIADRDAVTQTIYTMDATVEYAHEDFDIPSEYKLVEDAIDYTEKVRSFMTNVTKKTPPLTARSQQVIAKIRESLLRQKKVAKPPEASSGSIMHTDHPYNASATPELYHSRTFGRQKMCLVISNGHPSGESASVSGYGYAGYNQHSNCRPQRYRNRMRPATTTPESHRFADDKLDGIGDNSFLITGNSQLCTAFHRMHRGRPASTRVSSADTLATALQGSFSREGVEQDAHRTRSITEDADRCMGENQQSRDGPMLQRNAIASFVRTPDLRTARRVISETQRRMTGMRQRAMSATVKQ